MIQHNFALTSQGPVDMLAFTQPSKIGGRTVVNIDLWEALHGEMVFVDEGMIAEPRERFDAGQVESVLADHITEPIDSNNKIGVARYWMLIYQGRPAIAVAVNSIHDSWVYADGQWIVKGDTFLECFLGLARRHHRSKNRDQPIEELISILIDKALT